MDLDELLDVARRATAEGARAAMAWRERADELLVQQKTGPGDLVSQADHDAERAVRAVLTRLRPDDAVLGEEGGASGGSSSVRWIVDPIDGTTNYLYGRPDWAVSVAAATDDDVLLVGVVAEPMTGRVTYAKLGGGVVTNDRVAPRLAETGLATALVELNFGRGPQRPLAPRAIEVLLPIVRDLRRGGSAAVALAQVATGRADAAWTPGLQPWDCAAGALLVHEAGGLVGDLDGATPASWPASGDVLAAHPVLWQSLRARLAVVYQPAHV